MENKICINCNNSFQIEADDFAFYERMKVSAPNKCPQCRDQQRMLYRNFKTLYKRKSTFSEKLIISMYKENTRFPVFESDEWYSDNWNALDYGREIDWSRPLFEQLKELFESVPHPALINVKSNDCEWANMAYESANCYLVFGCVENEDCAYGHITWNSQDTFDTLYAFKCESCYECTDCLSSNKLFYSEECESCADSIGLFDCRSCTDCIGCVGLVGKSRYIFNQPVDHETYKKFLEENPLSSPETISMILEKREALREKVPQRAFFGSHNNNVSGNHIYFAKNILDSFDIKSGEDSRHCYTVRSAINTYDASFCPDVEESYQVLNCKGQRIFGSHLCVDSHSIYYSDHCYGSENLFGCHSLRQKSYCILNKQYTKEEYEELLPRLIEHMKKFGEWGEFFPKELSPFAYNESIVNEYTPLSKNEALKEGFRWQDDIPATRGAGTIKLEALPKNPNEYSEDLVKEILTCELCEKNYKLIPDEINFYKRMKLSIPSKCFNCRHETRMKLRNKRMLWNAKCNLCEKDIKTSYEPAKQKIYTLYCESCYQKEML